MFFDKDAERAKQFKRQVSDMLKRSKRPISATEIARLARRAGVGTKFRELLHELGAEGRQLERHGDGKHWYWAMPDVWKRYDDEREAERARQGDVWCRQGDVWSKQGFNISVDAALRIIDPDQTPGECVMQEIKQSVFLPLAEDGGGYKPEDGAEWFAQYLRYAVATGRIVILTRRNRT
ncbi:hypothetical protein [Mesorhizobium argentiipisi]|uniref:Uncharacterized protein n=1 Tax=Mesorhizobium argentiipisi TaxID=3015175 RepID=A0ABU8KHV2_9HYPH